MAMLMKACGLMARRMGKGLTIIAMGRFIKAILQMVRKVGLESLPFLIRLK